MSRPGSADEALLSVTQRESRAVILPLEGAHLQRQRNAAMASTMTVMAAPMKRHSRSLATRVLQRVRGSVHVVRARDAVREVAMVHAWERSSPSRMISAAMASMKTVMEPSMRAMLPSGVGSGCAHRVRAPPAVKEESSAPVNQDLLSMRIRTATVSTVTAMASSTITTFRAAAGSVAAGIAPAPQVASPGALRFLVSPALRHHKTHSVTRLMKTAMNRSMKTLGRPLPAASGAVEHARLRGLVSVG